jgi:hypothetical protein
MKLFFTVFLLILIGNPIYSQTITKDIQSEKISEIKDLTAFSMGLEKVPGSDIYFLVYRDAQYTQITDIKTITLGSKEEVSNIKKALVELMGDSSSESITVQLKEEEKNMFKRVEAMGIVNINGYVFVRGFSDVYGITGYLTKKRLEKLFPTEIFN